MVAAFPIAKIFFLLVKQVSKPLANAVKSRARSSPFFRNYICIPPAQFYHRCEVRVKMWSMNLGKPVNIPKLNEAQAIEFGAELIGESVIFGIATIILIAEYTRSTLKESAKEEARRNEVLQIHEDLKSLYLKNHTLEAQVRELVRIHRVTVPEVAFSPQSVNEQHLPEHYQQRNDVEPSPGMFYSLFETVKGVVDYVIPGGSAEPEQKLQGNSAAQPPKNNDSVNPSTQAGSSVPKQDSSALPKGASQNQTVKQ